MTGLSPFAGNDKFETFANITRGDYDFDDEAFDAISQDAMDFISALLQPKKRWEKFLLDNCSNHFFSYLLNLKDKMIKQWWILIY